MASHSPPLSSLNLTDDERDRAAGLRLLRQFGVFVAAGYVFYAIITFPSVVASWNIMEPWWTVCAWVLTFGTGIAVGPVAWRGSARRIRGASAVAVAGYLITVATWWFGWNGELLDGDNIWFFLFCGLAAIAAAVAFPPLYAFVVLCVVVPSTITVNHIVRPPEVNGPWLPDMAWAFAFSLIYFAAAVMAMRVAAMIDSTRAEAFSATAEAAAQNARSVERQRFAQLTHDGVMSTLLSASRQGASEQLAQQARATLADLDSVGVVAEESLLSADAAIAQIRGACVAVDPGLHIRVLGSVPRGEGRYPSSVVEALVGAAAEAVRNSRRHAGEGVSATVSVTASPGRLSVDVTDEGVGFDPRLVSTERLGIAVSIRGRMNRLDGGTAVVDSGRGQGTRVLLEWAGS